MRTATQRSPPSRRESKYSRSGEPLATGGRPTSEAIDKLTADCFAAILALVHDAPELARPGRVGRWLTDLFNDWPEGHRPD